MLLMPSEVVFFVQTGVQKFCYLFLNRSHSSIRNLSHLQKTVKKEFLEAFDLIGGSALSNTQVRCVVPVPVACESS